MLFINGVIMYLSTYFESIYPIIKLIDNIDFVAMNLYIDWNNIVLCCDNNKQYKIETLIYDSLYCLKIDDINEKNKIELSINTFFEKLQNINNIGISELYMTEFFESMILFILNGCSTLMPIFIKYAKLYYI